LVGHRAGSVLKESASPWSLTKKRVRSVSVISHLQKWFTEGGGERNVGRAKGDGRGKNDESSLCYNFQKEGT